MYRRINASQGVDEAEASIAAGNYIITVHTLFESPLTLSFRRAADIFTDCVSKQIPVMLVTQPFSGHNAPMTPYGTALIAFSEFLAGMAFASAINPETRVINGALPTLCTPGKTVKLKIGSIVHNFT
ncbi:MAG: trimethylamine methyltransferase family protein, partial [Desulfobacula sp.]|nr:trimethylamine methyltransferase family protein [Desulfobacula sp.]